LIIYISLAVSQELPVFGIGGLKATRGKIFPEFWKGVTIWKLFPHLLAFNLAQLFLVGGIKEKGIFLAGDWG